MAIQLSNRGRYAPSIYHRAQLDCGAVLTGGLGAVAIQLSNLNVMR